LETANRQISNRPPNRGRSTPPRKRKRKHNCNTAADQREEARGEERREEEIAEETRCKRMPRRLATSVRRRRFRALDSNERRKKGTKERTKMALFTLVLALEFKRGFCPGWLQRSRTNEKSGLAGKASRPHGWMYGWMDEWMTLEIGRR
jgi:hypothetical protein